MHYFGCDEKMRQQYMKEINESNAKRDGGKRFKKHPLDVIEERFYKGKTISASKIQLEEKTKHDGGDFGIGEVIKSEASLPTQNTECFLPDYLDEYFRDKKIDGETVTLVRGEQYGKLALRVEDRIYEVSYKYLRKVDKK